MTKSGSEIYAAFVEAELQAENDRRDSVNRRAATALTGSTALITLALAIIALLVGKDCPFPETAQAFLILALACLLGAGGCAVAAGFPWRQHLVSVSTLNRMLGSHRNDSEAAARDAVAYCNAVSLVSVSSGTSIKTRFLLASGICQILAIGTLGLSIWAVVADQPDCDDYYGSSAASVFSNNPWQVRAHC